MRLNWSFIATVDVHGLQHLTQFITTLTTTTTKHLVKDQNNNHDEQVKLARKPAVWI